MLPKSSYFVSYNWDGVFGFCEVFVEGGVVESFDDVISLSYALQVDHPGAVILYFCLLSDGVN